MSFNSKLDRRHDCNANEYLPQRLTRVQDMEVYWDGIEKVLTNEQNAAFVAEQKTKKEKVKMELAEKKASIKVGDLVLLLWAGVQVARVDDIRDESVKIGPVWYGWEIVQKPSEAFLKAVEAELPGVVL